MHTHFFEWPKKPGLLFYYRNQIQLKSYFEKKESWEKSSKYRHNAGLSLISNKKMKLWMRIIINFLDFRLATMLGDDDHQSNYLITYTNHQPIGIYGWRKRCLYALVLTGLFFLFVNILLTWWLVITIDLIHVSICFFLKFEALLSHMPFILSYKMVVWSLQKKISK